MSDRSGKKKADKNAPSKQVLNLYVPDERENFVPTVLLYVMLGLVVLLAIAKFEVVDRLLLLQDTKAELANVQDQILQTQLALRDYDTVSRNYVLYSDSHLDLEAGIADRMDILDLLETYLLSDTTVTSISVVGNEINVEFADASLEEVSALAGALEAEAMVESVTVSTASTAGSQNSFASSTEILMTHMQIVVNGEEVNP